MTETSRRELIHRAVLSGAFLSLGKLVDLGWAFADEGPADPWRRGERVGELEFQAESQDPAHVKLHSGLDTRLYTDLAKVSPERLITPVEEFYIRTGVPDRLDLAQPWRVRLSGLVAKPTSLPLEELEPLVESQGTHLMECAGNSRLLRFGLLSAAEWSGVLLEHVLPRVEPLPQAASVLVEGFDDHTYGSTTSQLGCSWIFPLNQLLEAGAFLATHMNGRRLTPDHGAPIRLMVPGWYGCCCVKWVQRIELVDSGRPATTQMREFATRTHHEKVLEAAADYRPAKIVRSALPIRVETWRIDGKTRYRVVGIDWGGDRKKGRLRIRFSPSDPYVPVDQQDPASSGSSWSLWSHAWSPARPGPYLIQLEVDDSSVETPRLDAGHYIRAVKVLEV